MAPVGGGARRVQARQGSLRRASLVDRDVRQIGAEGSLQPVAVGEGPRRALLPQRHQSLAHRVGPAGALAHQILHGGVPDHPVEPDRTEIGVGGCGPTAAALKVLGQKRGAALEAWHRVCLLGSGRSEEKTVADSFFHRHVREIKSVDELIAIHAGISGTCVRELSREPGGCGRCFAARPMGIPL